MREPAICCAVDLCRITGRPTFGRTVFICTKHMKVCESADLTSYAHAAGDRRVAEARALSGRDRGLSRARFLEESSWSRLVDQVKARCGFKPELEL